MRRARADLYALAASALSVWVLLWPHAPGDPLFAHSDKVVHTGLFALLTAAWLRRRPSALARLTGWLLPLAGVVAWAVGSELLQGALLADRSGDPRDVAADLAGVSVAAAAVALLVVRAGRGRRDEPGQTTAA